MSTTPPAPGTLLTRIAYALVALTAALLTPGWVLFYLGAGLEEVAPWWIGGAVAAVAGISVGHAAILRRTGEAGERILFETFFPMFMALVPLAGPFIALWSAGRLLLGRLGAATISSGSSSNSYEASRIGRAGVPAGLILVMIAASQPLLGIGVGQRSAAEDETQAVAERLASYGKAGCAGLVDCYTQADFIGQVAGRVVIPVDERGTIGDVEVTMPNATEAITACVRATVTAKVLPDFAGPAGRVVCEWAGSVSGKVRTVELHAEFLPSVERE